MPKAPFDRFTEFTRRIVGVPKPEIDKKIRTYERQKKRKHRSKS